MRAPIGIALLFALTTLVVPVHAEVFSYTDDEGSVHFVDSPSKIPPEYRKKIRRVDMPSHPAPLTPESEPVPVETVEAEAPEEAPPEGEPEEKAESPPSQDLYGRSETWWRRRKERLDAKRREVEAELAKLDKTNVIDVRGFYTRQALHDRGQRREQLNEKLAEIDRKIADLREEARQAGAPPGWLR